MPDPIEIVVEPDGSLLLFFLAANLTPFLPPGSPIIPWRVMVTRSGNAGKTWSRATHIASIDHPFPPHDPRTGAEVRAYPEISAGVAPDGTAYVAWNEILSEHSSHILVARSTSGGRRWGAPRAAATVRTQAFLPALATNGDGDVGVLWDDLRGDRRDDRKLTTRVRFAHSSDGGRTWRAIRISTPFDLLSTAETESTGIAGHFIGDYQGLAGTPHGWVTVFGEGQPIHPAAPSAPAIRGPSDIFFARLR